MSTNKSSKLLVNIIKKYFPKNKDITITDGTSNVGSDTVMLAMNFKKVNAIELSDITCKALIHNVKEYKQNNVKVFCGNIIDVVKETKQDVIYVDPPWGGPKYKYHSKLKLFLDNMEISEFYKVNKSRAKIFIFRVPINYDFIYFFNEDLIYSKDLERFPTSSRDLISGISNSRFPEAISFVASDNFLSGIVILLDM